MTSSSSASSSAPVESLPSTSVESSTSSEVSSDDHLTEIQRQYVANAMLMARSLSPEQLQKRTRQLSDQLSAIDTTDQATDQSTSSAEAAALRLANRIPKKSKKRARLTIVSSPPQNSDDPAAESSSLVSGCDRGAARTYESVANTVRLVG
jgi:hypothetical protein